MRSRAPSPRVPARTAGLTARRSRARSSRSTRSTSAARRVRRLPGLPDSLNRRVEAPVGAGAPRLLRGLLPADGIADAHAELRGLPALQLQHRADRRIGAENRKSVV